MTAMTAGAFMALLRPIMPKLRGRAVNLGGKNAEDLLQDTLVKAWAARASFTPGTGFDRWLCTIMRNIAIDRAKWGASAREAPWSPELLADITAAPPAQEPAVLLGEAVMKMQNLNAAHQAVLRLSCFELTNDQAAAELQIAAGTFRSRLFRARAALAAAMVAGEDQRRQKPGHAADQRACTDQDQPPD